MSGARRWWAEPPVTALGESLSPAPAPRVEDTLAGLQPREVTTVRKRRKKLDQLSVSISSPILRLFSLGTTVASESQAAQYHILLLLYSIQPPLLSQFCH